MCCLEIFSLAFREGGRRFEPLHRHAEGNAGCIRKTAERRFRARREIIHECAGEGKNRLFCRCLSFSLSSLFQLSFFIFHTKLENATNSTCFIHLLQRSCAYTSGACEGGGGAKIVLRALFSYSAGSYFFICNAIRTAVHSSMPYRGETFSLPEHRAATPFSFMSTAAQKKYLLVTTHDYTRFSYRYVFNINVTR